jgi:hypothetical protein
MDRFRAMKTDSSLRQAGERLVVGVKTVWRLMNDPYQSEQACAAAQVWQAIQRLYRSRSQLIRLPPVAIPRFIIF